MRLRFGRRPRGLRARVADATHNLRRNVIKGAIALAIVAGVAAGVVAALLRAAAP
jgi:predicted PurR-regulated permease PerM